jgi:hypothetical protein
MREIQELISKIDVSIKKELFDSKKEQIKKVFDYKTKEKEYYSKEIDYLFKKIKKNFSDLNMKEKDILEVQRILAEVEKNLNPKNSTSLKKVQTLLSNLLEFILESIKIKSNFSLPNLPKEIESEIKSNFYELDVCFNSGCYRSVLILCGKILEIALHRKHFEVTGQDLLEKSPDLGLGNLVKKMNEKGIDIDPGLSNQIHLINQLRIYSVHKKSQSFNPSKDQAQATILYTLDSLKKLFK